MSHGPWAILNGWKLVSRPRHRSARTAVKSSLTLQGASNASRTGACARPGRSRRLKETGARALAEGKPEKIVDKVVEGRLSKFYEEVCLYDQPFIKDNTLTIAQLIATRIAKIGENISVSRFARFKIGDQTGG